VVMRTVARRPHHGAAAGTVHAHPRSVEPSPGGNVTHESPSVKAAGPPAFAVAACVRRLLQWPRGAAGQVRPRRTPLMHPRTALLLALALGPATHAETPHAPALPPALRDRLDRRALRLPGEALDQTAFRSAAD